MSIPELVWNERDEAPLGSGASYQIFHLSKGGVELWYWSRERQECLGEYPNIAAAKAAARTHVGDDG
jgi:hypothetical protein